MKFTISKVTKDRELVSKLHIDRGFGPSRGSRHQKLSLDRSIRASSDRLVIDCPLSPSVLLPIEVTRDVGEMHSGNDIKGQVAAAFWSPSTRRPLLSGNNQLFTLV